MGGGCSSSKNPVCQPISMESVNVNALLTDHGVVEPLGSHYSSTPNLALPTAACTSTPSLSHVAPIAPRMASTPASIAQNRGPQQFTSLATPRRQGLQGPSRWPPN